MARWVRWGPSAVFITCLQHFCLFVYLCVGEGGTRLHCYHAAWSLCVWMHACVHSLSCNPVVNSPLVVLFVLTPTILNVAVLCTTLAHENLKNTLPLCWFQQLCFTVTWIFVCVYISIKCFPAGKAVGCTEQVQEQGQVNPHSHRRCQQVRTSKIKLMYHLCFGVVFLLKYPALFSVLCSCHILKYKWSSSQQDFSMQCYCSLAESGHKPTTLHLCRCAVLSPRGLNILCWRWHSINTNPTAVDHLTCRAVQILS